MHHPGEGVDFLNLSVSFEAHRCVRHFLDFFLWRSMGGDETSGGSFLRFLSALIDKEFFGFSDDDVSEAMERRQHETHKKQSSPSRNMGREQTSMQRSLEANK